LSAEALPANGWTSDAAARLRTVRHLRYCFGLTLGVLLVGAVDFTLAYLTPVLMAALLGPPARRMPLKAGLGFVLTIAVACGAGLVLGGLLLPYPAVFLLVMPLLLFRVFHGSTGPLPAFLATWLLIAFTAVPLVALESPAVASSVAVAIVVNAAVAVVLVWIAHALVPDPEAPAGPPPAGRAREQLGADVRLRAAALSTLAVLPLYATLYVFGLTSSVLMLVFVAMLATNPSWKAGLAGGRALLLGNLAGGLVAVVVYELLSMAPLLPMLGLLTFLAALLVGAGLFSDRPTAPLFGTAMSTVVLIVCSSTASFAEADEKLSSRLLQIGAAVVYVAVAFGLVERLTRRRGA
jgi:hypothetical protein